MLTRSPPHIPGGQYFSPPRLRGASLIQHDTLIALLLITVLPAHNPIGPNCYYFAPIHFVLHFVIPRGQPNYFYSPYYVSDYLTCTVCPAVCHIMRTAIINPCTPYHGSLLHSQLSLDNANGSLCRVFFVCFVPSPD